MPVKDKWFSSAMACVGAVVGAGFASGREIVSFFTCYGNRAWWLILFASTVMAVLCALCMRVTACGKSRGQWHRMVNEAHPLLRTLSHLCTLALMMVTGGAMIAAGGHMLALLWPMHHARPIGAACTMVLAWVLGRRSLRPMSWLSGMLIILFLLMMGAAFAFLPRPQGNVMVSDSVQTETGFLRAAAYAAMNLTLALGVICQCGVSGTIMRVSSCFGVMIALLLLSGHLLYSLHPECAGAEFPVVRLMAGFGRAGYVASAFMMYLSVLTTLTAVLYAIRGSVEHYVRSPWAGTAIALGIPSAVSALGFGQIVDTLYTPAGLLCILLVFLPLACDHLSRKQTDT